MVKGSQVKENNVKKMLKIQKFIKINSIAFTATERSKNQRSTPPATHRTLRTANT